MKKYVTVLLAAAMCLSLCLPALAVSKPSDTRKLNPEDIVDYKDIIFAEEVLGTSADVVYDNTPSFSTAGSDNIRGSLLFSMTAAGVTDSLLVTSPTKSFYKSALTNGYLKIAGTLNNPGYDGEYIKVGACYYDSASDEFISATYDYFLAGTYARALFPQSDFLVSTQYRGFIKNSAAIGSVSGSLRFYNSSGD